MVLTHHPPPTPTPYLPIGGATDADGVLWRTWAIAPDHRPCRRPTAILTGLFGFPWPSTTLDARCTRGDDRHHRVVPDPDCTCGIYGFADVTALADDGVLPIGRPVAHGFVAVEGVTVIGNGVARAQRATLIGPLVIAPGRRSLTVRALQRLGVAQQPGTVVDEGAGFRVTWGAAVVGTPFVEWRAWAAAELSARYGVAIE